MLNLSKDLPAKEKFVNQICDKLSQCDSSLLYDSDNLHSFTPFPIEAIYQCTDAALTALSVLNHPEYLAEKSKLEALMESYGTGNPTSAALSLFKSAFRAAVFWKNATGDSLDTADKKQKEANTEKGKTLKENSGYGSWLTCR